MSTMQGTEPRKSSKHNRPSNTSGETNKDGKRKHRHGFRVGPKPAPGVYTGKADKIKAALIRNAKIKQQYAKVLKKEGRAFPTRSRDDHAEDEDMSNPDSGDHDQEDSTMTIASPFQSRTDSAQRKGKGKGRARDAMPVDLVNTKSVLRKRKSGELENVENTIDDAEAESDDMDINDRPAPGPDRPPMVMQVYPSRRTSAAGSALPPLKKQRMTPAELEQKRQERENERTQWAKKSRKGQPNMGSRVNVLLGKIQRGLGRPQ